jgi:hypothetical protein
MTDRPHLWTCPKCTQRAASRNPHPAPMHTCRGLRGLSVPLIPDGVKADRRMVEREDFIGSEDVQYDGEGRPTMAVVTERDDGNDVTVYAPCARVGVEV